MSGGHYDYACWDLARVREKLESEKGLNDRSDKCRKILIKKIKKLESQIHKLEWYDSCDTGEDSLLDLEKQLKIKKY